MTDDGLRGARVPRTERGGPDGAPRGSPETYAHLLLVARKVIGEKGYARTTVDDIVTSAAVARGTFYLYFKSKKDIFLRLIASVIRDLYDRAEARRPGDSIFGRLEAGNRAFLEAWSDHGDLLFSLVQLREVEEEFREIERSMRYRFIDRTRRSLERHHERGLTHQLDPVFAAATLAGMVERAAIAYFAHGEPPGIRLSTAEMSYALTCLWYRAVYNSSAPAPPPRSEWHAGFTQAQSS